MDIAIIVVLIGLLVYGLTEKRDKNMVNLRQTLRKIKR